MKNPISKYEITVFDDYSIDVRLIVDAKDYAINENLSGRTNQLLSVLQIVYTDFPKYKESIERSEDPRAEFKKLVSKAIRDTADQMGKRVPTVNDKLTRKSTGVNSQGISLKEFSDYLFDFMYYQKDAIRNTQFWAHVFGNIDNKDESDYCEKELEKLQNKHK